MVVGPSRRHRESGQAAVETALTMPLTLFMFMGCMQLFMLLQAKQMAQYSVYQAARMGSVSNGDCKVINETAILTFSPAIRSLGRARNAYASQLGAVFSEFKNNDYNTFQRWTGSSWAGDAIVWIIRESPRFPGTALTDAREDWDVPLQGGDPVRLELRAIYWAPLNVPFADWVFSRMALAHMGFRPNQDVNPLAPTHRRANWTRDSQMNTWSLDNPIAGEFQRRLAAKHYVYPIEVTYSMRMMSPIKTGFFATTNCPPTPGSL